jgi:hypothetical protein
LFGFFLLGIFLLNCSTGRWIFLFVLSLPFIFFVDVNFHGLFWGRMGRSLYDGIHLFGFLVNFCINLGSLHFFLERTAFKLPVDALLKPLDLSL